MDLRKHFGYVIMKKEVKDVKDIPIFTTEYGTASLVLREIPYLHTAYVRILTVEELPELLEECISFCRAAGAQQVYATAPESLEGYPLHNVILRMRCLREQLGDTDAALFPVQEHTLEQWLRIYRQKVCKVPNGAWMTDAEGKQMLCDGTGYFVHRGEQLLGIGKIRGNTLEFLASLIPSAGADIVRALSHAVFCEDICLDVASANGKALKLYESLGFIPVEELTKWYKIF